MTEKPGIQLADYITSKGPLPGPQVAKLAIQLAQVMGAESESETGSRAPVLHTGRIVITTSGKIDITPSDETDLGLPIVASFPHHSSRRSPERNATYLGLACHWSTWVSKALHNHIHI